MIEMIPVIVLGVPGSGKGTQSRRLISEFPGSFAIAPGELVRKELANNGDTVIQEIVAAGKLLDDGQIMKLVASEVNRIDVKNPDLNFLFFDGVPRNISQVSMLDTLLESSKFRSNKKVVIFLELKKRKALKRLLIRIVCKSCMNSYKNCNVGSKCPNCGSELSRRSDDNAKIIRNRLVRDEKAIKSLYSVYNSIPGVACFRVDGSSREERVFARLCGLLRQFLVT